MWDVQACRCCLSTDPGLRLLVNPFDYYYKIISGVDLFVGDGYPRYICFECLSRLETAYEFRKRCQKVFIKMKSVMNSKHELTLSHIKDIERQKNKSSLGLWNASAQYFTTLVASPHLDKENTEHIPRIVNEKAILKVVIPRLLIENEQANNLVESPKDNLFYTTDNGLRLSINEYGYIKRLPVETQVVALQIWTESEAYKLAKFKCDKCHEIFPTLPSLIHHNDKHNISDNYCECSICHALFKSKQYLMQHQSRLHCWKIVCKYCGYISHVVEVFHKHLKKEHKSVLKYLSGDSDTPLTDKETPDISLNERRDRNMVAWPRYCIYCNKKLANSELYKAHYTEKHPTKRCTLPPKKMHICKMCGKIFHNLLMYESHVNRICAPKKFYQCRTCNKRSYQLDTMFQHLVVTHQQDPYKCDICPKLFTNNSSCKKHVSTLLLRFVEKKCNLCGEKCNNLESLMEHLQSHHMVDVVSKAPINDTSSVDKNDQSQEEDTEPIRPAKLPCVRKTYQVNGLHKKLHVKEEPVLSGNQICEQVVKKEEFEAFNEQLLWNCHSMS